MEITEADVNRPLAELVENSREKVVIEDIAEYSEIFFSIEYIVLNFWQKKPALKDKTVLSAYHKLKKDFFAHESHEFTRICSTVWMFHFLFLCVPCDLACPERSRMGGEYFICAFL